MEKEKSTTNIINMARRLSVSNVMNVQKSDSLGVTHEHPIEHVEHNEEPENDNTLFSTDRVFN